MKGGKLEVRKDVVRWGCARGNNGALVVGVGLRQYACGSSFGFEMSTL